MLTPKSGGMEYAPGIWPRKWWPRARVWCLISLPTRTTLWLTTPAPPELWAQTEGQITHFVSAMGTTGTITGVAKFLKEKNPAIRIIGAEPAEGSRIPGIRKWPQKLPTKLYP